MTSSASSRYFTTLPGMNSPTPARLAASSAAYPSWRRAMPGIMSSYRSCMIPKIPIRGLRSLITASLRVGHSRVRSPAGSALAVLVLVSPVQGVDLVGRQRGDLTPHAGQMDRAGRVLAHHRRLDRVARGGAHGEHPMAAQQHGR